MNEAERKRADRIAMMRLKMNTRQCSIPAAEQMFLFLVEEDGKRNPVMISRHWTIGRCVDHIAKQFAITNHNATFGAKVFFQSL
ncbi:unnamed protein product [Gongylonema pulchrum]|uniref:FERM domain-containing protein n=1 Tax=Gongylonema pulchrum TaxID=637853 RepID=A0A183D7I1_9BILA|nr:unnamed protein product [Gongylonema pulchrum]